MKNAALRSRPTGCCVKTRPQGTQATLGLSVGIPNRLDLVDILLRFLLGNALMTSVNTINVEERTEANQCIVSVVL